LIHQKKENAFAYGKRNRQKKTASGEETGNGFAGGGKRRFSASLG